MSVTLTQSPLAANLAGLGERNADLVAGLRTQAPAADIVFEPSEQGVLTARDAHGRLASRHRPLDEHQALIDGIDLLEKSVVAVFGFGLGYHVQTLVERLGGAGLIVVFEPDLALLRAVLERIDHSAWMKDALLVFVTSPTDRGQLARKLEGAEAIVGQGVKLLVHPASRRRLGERSAQFSLMLTDYVTGVKTRLVTTLVRSVDSIRNLLRNADHYVGGTGIAPLAGIARGHLGVVVSAGPSLRRNVDLLAAPGVRDRCVIIAVQTTLKPLLAAGIRPHFVTALDYHEISRRFYDGLTAEDVAGTTLIVDARAHPTIIDSFPGSVRCCAAPFLDRLLGPLKREIGILDAGATVAHLAVYLARFLGCNPIAMIGQDLGFSDGLYYAPGTAIHDVWAPELNPFNTLVMLEWQRIVRHRHHLHRTVDVHGRSIYTDAQMLTYLQQFERDFATYAEEKIDIIDATEGGVVKQHTRVMPLAEVLDRYGRSRLPELPPAPSELDQTRLAAADARFGSVLRDIEKVRDISRETAPLLRRMLKDQADTKRFERHFQKVDRLRGKMATLEESMELLNAVNQLGAFKRIKSDRRLHLTKDRDPVERQRAQLDRDLENVVWLGDAAQEFVEQLDDARRVLRGESVPARALPTNRTSGAAKASDTPAKGDRGRIPTRQRVAALVPIDSERNGLGAVRSLSDSIDGVPVLQLTLERLARSRNIDSIILIAQSDLPLEPLLDRNRIAKPIEIERTMESPFGPEQAVVAAARRWAEPCWRGGLGGASIWDEVLCPVVMLDVCRRHDLAAAVIVGPDWPCVDVTPETGVDALVDRFMEHPDHHRLVFAQSPPGLSGCLVATPMMEILSRRAGINTIGGFLGYLPGAPRGDLIATDANLQVEHEVRNALVRATFDSPRQRSLFRRVQDVADPGALPPVALVAALEHAQAETVDPMPRHVIIELTSDRPSRGFLNRRGRHRAAGPPLTRALFDRIFTDLAEADAVVTFGGAGDPLLHDSFDELVGLARDAGVRHVHLRTELNASHAVLDRLLASGADVISVDLHADCAATYERTMGVDAFDAVLANIVYCAERRRGFAGPPGRGLALPWIVPRLERRIETYEDIDGFYDRWQRGLGAAVLESPPPGANDLLADDDLAPVATPAAVLRREQRGTVFVRCDGSVLLDPLDSPDAASFANIGATTLAKIWPALAAARSGRSAS